MFRYKLLLAISAPLSLLGLLLAIVTIAQPVPVNTFAAHFQIYLGCILVAELVVGYLCGVGQQGFILASRDKQQEQRSLEWQAQDVKLLAEVKSDREKQLEAKIATLESALKQALKRS